MSRAQSYLFIPVENHSDIHTSVERFFQSIFIQCSVINCCIHNCRYAIVNLTVVYHWMKSCFVSVLSVREWPFINTETPIILAQSQCFSGGGKSRSSDTTCPSLTAEVFYGSAPASVNTKNQFILSKMFVVGISQNIGQSDLVVMYQ